MSRQFHGVVQNPADDCQIAFYPINQEMPGAAHDASCHTCPFPAQAQVPGTYAIAKLRAFNAAGPIR